MQGTWIWSLIREDPRSLVAAEQLKPWATTTEPKVLQLLKFTCLEPMHHKKTHHNEKPPALQLESSPHKPELEKACLQQWRPRTAKKEKKKI